LASNSDSEETLGQLHYVPILFYVGRMRIDRITKLAMRVLYDALARAECGAVERTWGHRLALEWLVKQGVAEPWQAEDFWQYLADQWETHQYEGTAAYTQRTHLYGALTNWSYCLGIEPLDLFTLGNMARPYQHELDFGSGTQQLPCMCNRYSPGDRHRIEDHFSARLLRQVNEGPAVVHPKEPGWVVRLIDGERVLQQMTWGFPVYLRGKSGQPLKPKPVNNARFDKLNGFWKKWAMKPEQRCLIPTAAFAEAVGPSGSMRTTWLSLKDSPVFAWAGLWRESDEWGTCYTGVMTENAPELVSIHDRSPVILDPQDWDAWLSAPLADLKRYDRPYPADKLKITSTNVLWKDGGREVPKGILADVD